MRAASGNSMEHAMRRLRYAHAVDLARAGAHEMAAAALVPTPDYLVTEDELDLLARISVAAGRYGMAEKHWRRALQLGEERQKYASCLEALDQYTNALRLRGLAFTFATAAIALCAGLSLFLWLLLTHVL